MGNIFNDRQKYNKTGKVQSIPEKTDFQHAFFTPSHSECS